MPKSRKVTIEYEIPTDFCNTCHFFSTWMPHPEDCTGFGGFRRYCCTRFQERLQTHDTKVHDRHHETGFGDSPEYKALPCKQCREEEP